MEDKRRKTKIPVHKVPPPVIWLLKNATSSQLNFLQRIAALEDFKDFVNLVSNFKHYNVYEVFNTPIANPEQLVALRAAKVGEVAGLDALIMVCQLAKEEKERRKRLKEGGT